MSMTTFSGPVRSLNGFIGDMSGGDLTVEEITVTGESSIDGATIVLPNLPTADPGVAGQLWNDAGALKVSAG